MAPSGESASGVGGPGVVAVGRAPIPADVRRVLIVGGTFDPPHAAHVALPREAARLLGADLTLYIPAARSPHKPDAPGASDADRLEMLRLALASEPRAAVATIELSEPAAGAGAARAPSYTIDTLRALRREAPGVTVWRLCIGADQAAAFHRWREPREIIALAEPAVLLREPYVTADALLAAMAPHWSAAELAEWRGRVLTVAPLRAAATEVRALLATGRTVSEDAALAASLPAGVLAYVRRRGLYGDSRG